MATVTLADVVRKYKPNVVHFLKVDVEGHEERVLRGMDFAACRPLGLMRGNHGAEEAAHLDSLRLGTHFAVKRVSVCSVRWSEIVGIWRMRGVTCWVYLPIS